MIKELAIFAVSLAVGLLGLPALTFVTGQFILGPYAGGGLGAIIANEFRGLGSGAISSWLIALAPYAVVLIARAIWNCDSIRTRLWPERDTLESENGARPGDS